MPMTAQDVRRIALSLPDSSEKPAWGMPTFRVGGKIFAALADDDASIGVKCPKEDRAELIAAEPGSSSCGPATTTTTRGSGCGSPRCGTPASCGRS